MTAWFWFWTITYSVFWVCFVVLFRMTKKLGIKPQALGWFWFTLVSITVGTACVIISLFQKLG